MRQVTAGMNSAAVGIGRRQFNAGRPQREADAIQAGIRLVSKHGERVDVDGCEGKLQSEPAAVAQTFESAVSPTFQSATLGCGRSYWGNSAVQRAGKPAIRQTGMSNAARI